MRARSYLLLFVVIVGALLVGSYLSERYVRSHGPAAVRLETDRSTAVLQQALQQQADVAAKSMELLTSGDPEKLFPNTMRNSRKHSTLGQRLIRDCEAWSQAAAQNESETLRSEARRRCADKERYLSTGQVN